MKKDAPISEEARQNLHQLAEALYSFLMELEGYRKICVRHDQTTLAMNARNDTLWLRKRYDRTKEIEETLERTLPTFKPWEDSPWYHASKEWEAMQKRLANQKKSIVSRGIAWEGYPILVTAWVERKEIVICTASPTTAIPTAAVEDFPLRRAAMALQCHEHLVPEFLGKPKPVSRGKNGNYPIKTYLINTLGDRKGEGDPIVVMLDHWPKFDAHKGTDFGRTIAQE